MNPKIEALGKRAARLSLFRLPVRRADIDSHARVAARSFGIKTINPENKRDVKEALSETDIVVTATGKKGILESYSKEWFEGKILANMGILDEFGVNFHEDEILNKKSPVNFILDDPTPIQYIDPEFYAHNIAALDIFDLPDGVSDLFPSRDQEIIRRWCQYHQEPFEQVTRWFIK